MNGKKVFRLALAVIILLLAGAITAAAVKVVYYKGHVNGRVDGFDNIDPSLFQARPMNSRYYMEIWYHEFHFEQDGIILNVNFQMHNLGIQRGYCDVFIMVSDPAAGLILEDYNALFRKLAYLIMDETWSYRFWADFKFELEIDGDKKIIAGKGVGNVVDSISTNNENK